MKKKTIIVVISTVAGIPLLLFVFGKGIFIRSGTACAKPLYRDEIRKADYFYYSYTVDGKNYTSHSSVLYFKVKDFDSLKETIECFEIRYSKMFPSFTEVIDKRVAVE